MGKRAAQFAVMFKEALQFTDALRVTTRREGKLLQARFFQLLKGLEQRSLKARPPGYRAKIAPGGLAGGERRQPLFAERGQCFKGGAIRHPGDQINSQVGESHKTDPAKIAVAGQGPL